MGKNFDVYLEKIWEFGKENVDFVTEKKNGRARFARNVVNRRFFGMIFKHCVLLLLSHLFTAVIVVFSRRLVTFVLILESRVSGILFCS